MIDFIKTVFASAIGFVVACFLFFFVIFIFVVSMPSDPEPVVRNNSVLHVKVSGLVPDRTTDNPFDQLFATPDPAGTSLMMLENNLKKAAVDDKIKGVLLEIEFVGTPWPTLQHMHRLITDFKEESGKFVYATTNDMGMNEQGYYLATAADSIFAPAFGIMQFDGFVIEGTFLKGMLDKIGVEAEVYHRGAYKSAGDGLVRDSFSDADREQLEKVFGAIVEEFESVVAARNDMSRDELSDLLNGPPRLNIEYFYERGLIDAIVDPEELESRIKARIGVDNNSSLSLLPNRRYARVSDRTAGLERAPRESIAVIYADGPIMPSTGEGFPFGGENLITVDNFRSSLESAIDDNNVKAIVVRINSPGGSASTSDVIWNLIRNASEKKPVIASMGSVAASGGYFIAMGADKIVAESTTITGSIGVIGMMLNANELMTDKLGFSYDEVRFHRNANWMNPNKPMTDEQRDAFAYFIDTAYDEFVEKVALSRNMDVSDVDAVAQGRIWSGTDAKELKLIDAVGGLDTALQLAAEAAELERYSLKILPREKTLLEMLNLHADVSVRNIFARDLPLYNELQLVKYLMQHNRADAWAIMPYMLEMK